MKTILTSFLILLVFTTPYGQSNSLASDILKSGSPLVQQVINDKNYEFQLIYSEINRDEHGKPRLTTHKFGVDDETYFYPASTIKMPIAFLALEKLNSLNNSELNMDTPIAFGAASSPQVMHVSDPTAKNEEITIAHLIKKIFLVSDNTANSLLYSICGQEFIHEQMRKKGYDELKLTHRVGASQFSMEDNRSTNPYLFYNDDKLLHIEAARRNPTTYERIQKLNCVKGKGYMSGGKLINEPFNFCEKNFISLTDLHSILAAFVLPEAVEQTRRYNITDEQRLRVLAYMSQRPRESNYPKYDKKYNDSYVKFFMVGDQEENMNPSLRIFNKVGYAYGYLTDIAYIVDLESGVEFMLSATVHVNKNQVFNDDKYEYDSIGIPFLSEVGRLFYNHEKQKRKSIYVKELNTLNYD